MHRRAIALVLACSLVLAGGLVAGRANSAATAAQHKARVDAAAKGFQLASARFNAGAATSEVLCAWSRRQYDAESAAGSSSAAADYVTRARAVERDVQTKMQAGVVSAADLQTATYYRTEAEVIAAGP